MFRKRPFPLDPAPLIRLVDHPNEWVVVRALTALEMAKHPDVRTLFHRLSEHPKWSERAIGLLRSNYQQGDCELILQMLEKETDLDRLHVMCIDTMDVYEDNLHVGDMPLALCQSSGFMEDFHEEELWKTAFAPRSALPFGRVEAGLSCEGSPRRIRSAPASLSKGWRTGDR